MIPTTTRRSPVYTGTGALASYAFAFKVFSKTDISVKVTDTAGAESTLTLDTQYSVALNADQDNFPGGTVTPLAAVAAGSTLVVIGDQAYSQTTQFPNGGAYNAVIAERAFDRLVVMIQQVLEKANRALLAPVNDTAIPGTLPAKTALANRFLAFDPTGSPFGSSGTGADAGLRADLAASTGSSLLGWLQAGTGGVLRLLRDKLRERWSLEDHGAVGNGVTDDRAAIQSVLNALSSIGGGTIYGVPGKTYLVGAKPATTKVVGSFARAFGIEIPSNVIIDLQGTTLKAVAATDYVLISNSTCTPGSANNSNLGIINGTIDYSQASAAGNSQAAAFYGVRKLRLDALEIKNGYNIALDLEACDRFDVGDLVFSSCTGASFYMGGATASGGAECTQGVVGSITCYDAVNHPTNPGLPGNPTLINASYTQFGAIKAFNCDAGHKVTAGHDMQIGQVLFQDGNTQNSGFKLQGNGETQIIERVSVGEVISKDCAGSGLFINWSRDVEIGNYIGKGNAILGLDTDVSIAGERIKIGNFDSIDAGQVALTLLTSNGNFFNRSPDCTIDNCKIVNPWTAATSGTATAIAITNGSLRVGLLSIVDNRAVPKMIRYLGTSAQTKEQSLTVDEFYGRGAASNPGFLVTGMQNAWIGRPDIAPLDFTGGTLTLSSAAVGTGLTAQASVAVFAATDVGKLLVAQDGRGVAEITGFTDAQNVTVANRIAWTGTAIADDAWYLDRASGGCGTFAPTAAATTIVVTDAGFANTASRGTPIIDVTPTNAAAITLGKVKGYTWSNGTVTFTLAGAAAGTETYSYRIRAWTT